MPITGAIADGNFRGSGLWSARGSLFRPLTGVSSQRRSRFTVRSILILDCRATAANATSAKEERCYSGYLYYNGYISQKQINSKNAAGLRNGVFGLPSDYVPFQKPINPWPVGGSVSDPGSNPVRHQQREHPINQRRGATGGVRQWLAPDAQSATLGADELESGRVDAEDVLAD